MTVVETSCGQIEGIREARGFQFLGIPFAKPPTGELRFRPPQAAEPWTGVRPAREFGHSAMQPGSEIPGMAAEGPKSEDCLYLNVYTPACDDARRPVLFWIHGGAFILGSAASPIYDGSRLSERGDVVVVTINYRLGAFGYLSLAEHGGDAWGATANLGQLDQIAALRWVQDNIAAFGGDPGKVTIFGESAGSVAVTTLLNMPEARGLFHRAVAQSGAALELARASEASRVAQAMLDDLGIGAGDSQKLQEVPAARLLEAQVKAGAVAPPLRGFAPCVDGKTLPKQPREAIEAGESAEVPLIIGTNRDEMNLFTMPLLKTIDEPMDDARAVEVLRSQIPARAREGAPALLAAYRNSREARGLRSGNRALLGAIQSDLRFRIPATRYADAYLQRQPATFMYFFEQESPAMRGALGACHALEIPFVFGTLDAPFQDRFAGAGPAVEQLSGTMMDAWIALARGGSPATEARAWDAYDPQRRATMVFGPVTGLQDAPYEEERAAWDGLV
ncbi:MAG: carboxylesterase family protein [Myxococcales bacterium]